ncbi:MAG: hypothetical protein ACP5KW_10790, partial [Thermoproteota archaeon]
DTYCLVAYFLIAIFQFLMKVEGKNETTGQVSSNNKFNYSLLLLLSVDTFLELVVKLGTNSWLPYVFD